MDLITLFYVGGMSFVVLAMPTLLIYMWLMSRDAPRTAARPASTQARRPEAGAIAHGAPRSAH